MLFKQLESNMSLLSGARSGPSFQVYKTLVKFVRSCHNEAYDRYPLLFHEQFQTSKDRHFSYMLQKLRPRRRTSQKFKKSSADPKVYRHDNSPGQRDPLEVLKIQYEVMKATGNIQMPKSMRPEDWYALRNLDPNASSLLYKSIKQEEEILERIKLGHIQNDEEFVKATESETSLQNPFYLDFEDNTSRQLSANVWNDRLANCFGKNVVVNCQGINSFREHISVNSICRNAFNNYSTNIYTDMNRSHKCPLNLHFVCQKNINIGQSEKDFPSSNFHHVHQEREIFPREKLVFISNSSPNVYENNTDDIPVIFNFGLEIRQDLVLEYAMRNNIRHATLPISKFVMLTNNPNRDEIVVTPVQQLEILRDVEAGIDWETAIFNNLLYPSQRLVRTSKAYQAIRKNRHADYYLPIHDLVMDTLLKAKKKKC
ncbi:uncharacterized protein LOC128217824 isoform X1 [Mya arenaria]|uniref:uncharacterized protein LOC128217824 isoform X1 n=2 Tax=Mya arenaria TaxID=6604 RepID=UPI0022E904F1|nr:uncharacterized protein LOC128217824 isoform X1 [Mya arenaria]